MNAQAILDEVRRRGASLLIVDGRLKVSPPGLLPDTLKAAIREQVAVIKSRLTAPPEPAKRPLPDAVCALWTSQVVPDSRSPLIPQDIRANIEAIECKARGMGWPPELLWNAGFWDRPRGLAAILDPDDQISQVTPEYIEILKCRRDLQRFRRHVA
jgi:hypothetical protein